MNLKHLLTGLCASAVFAAASHAATITWDAPQNITGASDVALTGTLVLAENMGSGPSSTVSTTVTVNTVTFQTTNNRYNFGAQVGSNPYTYYGAGFSASNSVYAGNSTTFAAMDSDYKTLLAQGNEISGAVGTGTTRTMQLRALTIGTTYLLQIWANDARGFLGGPSADENRTTTLNSSGGTAVDVLAVTNRVGNNSADNNPGQYVIGIFTADAVTQDYTVFAHASNAAMYSAYQIREIPEPASIALMGLGGCMMFVRSRRSR